MREYVCCAGGIVCGRLPYNNNLSLEKRVALSTPLHYTLLPYHIPPRPHTALSVKNVGRDWEGGKEGGGGAEGSVTGRLLRASPGSSVAD